MDAETKIQLCRETKVSAKNHDSLFSLVFVFKKKKEEGGRDKTDRGFQLLCQLKENS